MSLFRSDCANCLGKKAPHRELILHLGVTLGQVAVPLRLSASDTRLSKRRCSVLGMLVLKKLRLSSDSEGLLSETCRLLFCPCLDPIRCTRPVIAKSAQNITPLAGSTARSVFGSSGFIANGVCLGTDDGMVYRLRVYLSHYPSVEIISP